MRRALAFLTPLGTALPPNADALPWFPAVGLVLGFGLGGVWWLAARWWSAPVAAAVVLGADLLLTGMLHLDGLLDAADGLLPHLPRERRMEVMSGPEVGAFGIGTAIVVLLLRWASLAALPPTALVVGGLWCASRTFMATAMVSIPYARAGGGLASAFLGMSRGRGWVIVPGLAASLACLMGWRPLAGVVALAAGLVGATVVILLARRRLGGFTGDVLGAAGMVAETVGLLVAAAQW